MNPETHATPYTLPTYSREWVYTFLALAIGLTMYFKMQHPLTTKSALSAAAAPRSAQESYGWFFAAALAGSGAPLRAQRILRADVGLAQFSGTSGLFSHAFF